MKILIPYTHDFSEGKDIDQHEVDGWIRSAVKFLIRHPEHNEYGAASGNSKIIAIRGEDNEIIVYEFRNYKEHTFDLSEEENELD